MPPPHCGHSANTAWRDISHVGAASTEGSATVGSEVGVDVPVVVVLGGVMAAEGTAVPVDERGTCS
jgi:hypothetical protein